jgi:hypothetical protein
MCNYLNPANKKKNVLKEEILRILNSHTKEMEGYGYYGSNPGVPEDDYDEILNFINESENK